MDAPGLAKVERKRARSLALLGRLEGTIAALDAAIEIEDELEREGHQPADSATRTWSHSARATFLSIVGRHAEALRDYAVAIEQRCRLDLRDAEAAAELAKTYLDRGDALVALGDRAAALDDFQRAIDTYRSIDSHEADGSVISALARAHHKRANCLAVLVRSEEALADYDAAVELFARSLREDAVGTVDEYVDALRRRGLTLGQRSA